MIRVEADAVYLPAACVEQSTSAGDGDEGAGAAAAAATGGRCSSCFPRGRRRAGAADAAIAADADGASVARLPLDRLVGAELDARGRVRVWFTAAESDNDALKKKNLRGYVCPPALEVRVSAPVDADAGGEALVAALRASARRRGSTSNHPPPRVVAIVNPVSGRGKAARDFQREALPVLERAAGLRVETLPTRCAGHAKEIARGLDLGSSSDRDSDDDNNHHFSVVLAVVGGDGTLHEAVNGLLSRPDWRLAARRVLLAHVPCGSGNGVAVSCGLRSAAMAAVAVAKGARAPLDVSSVLVREASAAAAGGDLTRTFCVLSVVYGMMANLDVRTEPLRWMGESRFTLGGALEILGARSYACRGAWRGPAAGGGGFLGEEDVGGEEEEREEGGSAGGAGGPAAGAALLAGGRARSCDLLAAIGADDAAAAASGVLDDGGPPLPLLAQLLGAGGLPERLPDGAALPPGWRPLPLDPPRASNGARGKKGSGRDGQQGSGAHMFAAVGPPYVAGNYRFNPLGALSSGALRQMWVPAHSVRGLRGRLASLALQDAAADGTHLDAPRGAGLMRHAPAAALAFEPLAGPGETWVQLDGECVKGARPRAAMFCEVHKGLLSVAVRPGHPEEERVD